MKRNKYSELIYAVYYKDDPEDRILGVYTYREFNQLLNGRTQASIDSTICKILYNRCRCINIRGNLFEVYIYKDPLRKQKHFCKK